MKKALLIIFGVFFLSLLLNSESTEAQKTATGEEKSFWPPYKSPTEGEISIVASTPIPEKQKPTREAYKTLEDCGYNLLIMRGGLEFVKQQFRLIEDLDLSFLVRSNEIYGPECKEIVSVFKNEKRLAGWDFWDEPAYNDLPDLKEKYDRLHSLDPDRLIFINLIGAQIKNCTGPTKNYKEYLELIENYFHPYLWSYDLYPLKVENGRVKVSYDIFYSDFEMYRDMAKKTGRPFWAFCQSMGFKNKVVERPSPTESYLRFEAFSALAYGAQGIVYWTYGLRNSTENEIYISALVDLEGKKEKAWYAAQKVNSEIKKFNDVFFNCEVKEVKHTGRNLYRDTNKLTGEIGPFQKIVTGDAGVLVSYIINKDRKYIVIVNHEVEKTQKVSLILKNNNKVKELTDLTLDKNLSQKIDFKLPKGGYAIFQEI